VAALREAATRGDAGVLEREAHALKGSAATLGARCLAAICEELEACGRAGNPTRAAALLPRLEAELERVRAELGIIVAVV
jgi:HPt (histidine-containing phosphotransfer) domain-containing protein